MEDAKLWNTHYSVYKQTAHLEYILVINYYVMGFCLSKGKIV